MATKFLRKLWNRATGRKPAAAVPVDLAPPPAELLARAAGLMAEKAMRRIAAQRGDIGTLGSDLDLPGLGTVPIMLIVGVGPGAHFVKDIVEGMREHCQSPAESK